MPFYSFQESENIFNLAGSQLLEELVLELDNASSIIRPSFPLYFKNHRTFFVQNMIGVLGMRGGTLVEVTPKTSATSWEQAVLGLIDSSTRFYVTTTNRTCSKERLESALTEAIAIAYANALKRALCKEGPLLSYERAYLKSSKLSGRLNLSKWAVQSQIDPSHFDIIKDELQLDNAFARAMDFAAERMLASSITPATKKQLLNTLRALRPNRPKVTSIDSSIVERKFPEQWTAYRPAWEIASAIIRGGVFKCGSSGTSLGIEIAVEPWPMLETLLERCLDWICSETHYANRYETQKNRRILLGCNRSVKPDGLLSRNGKTVACIDAKYKTQKLLRNDLYQAIATAATFQSPIAILAYPDNSPMHYYPTTITNYPKAVATVGIDMFSYSKTADLKKHAIGIAEAIEASI